MLIRDICVSILLVFYVLFAGYYFILPLFGHAPYYPSSSESIRDMLRLADIKKSDRVIDLGSGDGRVVFAAAEKAGKVTGIEHNPFFVFYSKLKVLFSKDKKKIRFICGDIYKQDLSEYDVVLCYLLPKTMKKLGLKMKKELKPGTKIISNTFHIEGMKEEKVLNKIKLYVV